MHDDEPRQTQRVWEADLGEAGRRLTLAELAAMEAMHMCQLAHETLEAARLTTRYMASLEGRLDRLEQYLARIDPRYPQAEGPSLGALPDPERRP
jgi:ribosomal protein L16/L10AE